MPNWTRCKLSAIGRREDLQRFQDQTYSVDPDAKVENVQCSFAIDLEKIMPVPIEVEHDTRLREDGMSAAFHWRRNNWRTKWDTCDRSCGPVVAHPTIADRCSLTCVFFTAWSPPMPVIWKLINDWPMLDFRFAYVEEGGWDHCAAVITTTSRFVFGDVRDLEVTWVGDEPDGSSDGGTLQYIREFGCLPDEISDDFSREQIKDMFGTEQYGHVTEAYDVDGLVTPSARVAEWEARWMAWLAKPVEEQERWHEERYPEES